LICIHARVHYIPSQAGIIKRGRSREKIFKRKSLNRRKINKKRKKIFALMRKLKCWRLIKKYLCKFARVSVSSIDSIEWGLQRALSIMNFFTFFFFEFELSCQCHRESMINQRQTNKKSWSIVSEDEENKSWKVELGWSLMLRSFLWFNECDERELFGRKF
jgi:hypothetical protein